jgi:outer membrane lipoprotein-sorting protein
MKRMVLCAIISCGAIGATAAAEVAKPPLTAAQIVDKNVAARGGLAAWHKVETMVWNGRVETDKSPGVGLQFMLAMKRPNKTRFEVKAPTQQTVRAFDGREGWKMRPAKSGVPDVQPFDANELRYAQEAEGIDGLLIDYAANGSTIALDGPDQVEGHKTYRLRLTARSGSIHHVWVDAKTFLDVKYDRTVRNNRGLYDTISVAYRDYQVFEGIKIPMTIETSSTSGKTPDKMVIERVALNPALDDRLFAKPAVTRRHSNVVTVGEPPSRSVPRPARPMPPTNPADTPAAAPAPEPPPGPGSPPNGSSGQ